MKNKNLFISVMIIASILTWAAISFFGFQDIEELKQAVKERDSTIQEMSNLDSVYYSKTKKYSEIITKYVDNCNFFIGDKKISTSDLMKMTNELLEENQTLKDTLYYLKQLNDFENEASMTYKNELYKSLDSLHTVSRIIELIKKDYGINYIVSTDGNYKIFKRQLSRADSAIVLFPYYKNKLSYDTLTKAWNIKVQTTRELTPKPNEKKRNK